MVINNKRNNAINVINQSCKLYYWHHWSVFNMNKHLHSCCVTSYYEAFLYDKTVKWITAHDVIARLCSASNQKTESKGWWLSVDLRWCPHSTMTSHQSSLYCMDSRVMWPVSCINVWIGSNKVPFVLKLCLCLTCRWRNPRTKYTWVLTAWCSTCRTKTASSESNVPVQTNSLTLDFMLMWRQHSTTILVVLS